MKLMFDLRRNEELAKMGDKDKADVEKESLFRNYDSKDDVVWGNQLKMVHVYVFIFYFTSYVIL